MAKTLTVSLEERSYPIYINCSVSTPDFVEKVKAVTGDDSLFIVADYNSRPCAREIAAFLKKSGIKVAGCFAFHDGEAFKTFETVEKICMAAAKAGLDRRSTFMAVGGGVCGDLTGFASAIYMRGTKFIQVPTTLLAMADSSIGGKTGADLPCGKNLVGAFHQPRAVFMDFSLMSTLKTHAYVSGFGEIIKTAALFEEEFFSFLEKNYISLIGGKDFARMEEMLFRTCSWKAGIVTEDEKESSCRALLNYGHTFGHALETLDNYGLMAHGFAICIGMSCACTLSELLGMQTKEESLRLRELLLKCNLPIFVAEKFASRDILEAMKHDKKAFGGKLRFVLPAGIGRAEVVTDIPEKLVLQALDMTRIKL